MISFEHTDVVGWKHAIRGARNPLNSWGKSDSRSSNDEDVYENYSESIRIGSNDYDLMRRLRIAGTDHRKFMRMIVVYVDITAPLYWFKELDTYKVGTVANSCSTMHKIHAKEFTMEDFSTEHLLASAVQYNGYVPTAVLKCTIGALNEFRELYLESKNKVYWWQMIQLLPTSYNQKRTVMLNYEVLANIYKSRKDHKLDEWHEFCDWIKKELPYSDLLITGEIGA